jgi:hypothetical protein
MGNKNVIVGLLAIMVYFSMTLIVFVQGARQEAVR